MYIATLRGCRPNTPARASASRTRYARRIFTLRASFPPPPLKSMNFTFSVGEGGGRRLVFSLELQATPTNNVEVAIGHDANCDGHLSIDETALAVGYDCGEWFVRSAANDGVTYFDAATSGVFCRTYEVRSRNVDPLWNLVKVTRRGLGVTNENVGVELKPQGFGLTIQ